MSDELKVGDEVQIVVNNRWSHARYKIRSVIKEWTSHGERVKAYRLSGIGPEYPKHLVRHSVEQTVAPTFFDEPDEPETPVEKLKDLAHRDDPWTSHNAAKLSKVKRGKERFRLLAAFMKGDLTDEEAGDAAQIDGEYDARRHCTVLRRNKLIERTGETRPSKRGNPAMVCRITDEGERVWRASR